MPSQHKKYHKTFVLGLIIREMNRRYAILRYKAADYNLQLSQAMAFDKTLVCKPVSSPAKRGY